MNIPMSNSYSTGKALSIGVNGHTELGLLDIFAKMVEIERTTDAAGAGNDAVLDNIQAFLKGLPYSVAGVHTPEDLHKKFMYMHENGAELRYEEMLASASGRALPYNEIPATLAFPEVVDAENTE